MKAFIRPDVFHAINTMASDQRWPAERTARVMALARYAEREPLPVVPISAPVYPYRRPHPRPWNAGIPFNWLKKATTP